VSTTWASATRRSSRRSRPNSIGCHFPRRSCSTRLRGFLAELLGELAPGDLQECFFISNGTDAVEGALKLARLYTKKTGFISTTGGFHGKSMGSLSVMGRAVYRKPFQPLLSDVYFVD